MLSPCNSASPRVDVFDGGIPSARHTPPNVHSSAAGVSKQGQLFRDVPRDGNVL